MKMQRFDYIIVGAGSAGCVLANRLTEDSATTVLLIEAGGNDDLPAIHNPALAPTLFQTVVDWAYFTEEEPHLNNHKIFWPRGKVLGGSSSTNFMLYVRGHRHSYDRWQNSGNEGWGYDDVLTYFKKAENQEHGASDYHGVGGPLNISGVPSLNPMTSAFIEAGMKLGWSKNDDINGATQEGLGTLQFTVYQEKRQSAAVGYLHPAENRPNLTIWKETLVARVLFEGTRAIGVTYLKDGNEQQVLAHKEVILSGGSINSPQILLLSGIGPADHLRAYNIPVVANVPGVGHNLHDHPNVFTHYQTKQSFSQFGSGPEGVAFIKTRSDLPEPDIQLIFVPSFFPPAGTSYGFTIVPIVTNPQSRGHLELRSNDPTQYPAIFANYLDHEADRQTFIHGIKLARRLSQSKAFAPFYDKELSRGLHIQSDQEILEYIRNNLTTMFHPVGTCKMGNDEMAVVDAQLRVYGVQGLRVVDASIMPIIVNGNTNAAAIMIAEKAADFI